MQSREAGHAPETLAWELEEDKGTVWLRLRGALDVSSNRTFDKLLGELCRDRSSRIAIDCTALNYVNSTGIGILYKAHTTCGSNQGLLVLFGLSDKLQELVAVMGLKNVLRIVATSQEAVALFQEVPSP
jgi:anti-anti-sigma factor